MRKVVCCGVCGDATVVVMLLLLLLFVEVAILLIWTLWKVDMVEFCGARGDVGPLV